MMKKYIAISFLFLLMPSVMAAISIDDIRGYVNNERMLDVDDNGGDFDAEQGDTLDLVVRLKNSANNTVQAKLIGTIENIDSNADITDTEGFFDISANDDSSKTLSFTIPSNARRDDFNMELEIRNGSNDVIDTIDYSVIVDKNVIREEEVNVNEALTNLSNSCKAIVETTNICFGYVAKSNDCNSELSTVKEERGTFERNANECSEIKAELERQRTTLNDQISGMVSREQCINQTTTAINAVKEASDDKFNQTLLFAGGAIIAYVYYQKRKKARGDVASAYQDDYFDKS